MFTAQVVNPTPPPAPPPPPAVWLGGVFQDAQNDQVQTGISAMTQGLFAGVPSGYANKNGSATGYISLIESIIAAAAAKQQTYQAVYTSWPTNTVPVQSQSWLPGGLPTTNVVIGFGYDWRQDNLTATGPALQNFLQYLTQTGSTVDKITLIGHSMGGLVSRAYLESIGPNSKNPQDAKILAMVDQLITLGTPHLGAPMALAPISKTLEIVKGLGDEVFFYVLEQIIGSPSPKAIKNLTDIIDAVVNAPAWGASTYELLPPTPFIKLGGNAYPIYPYQNLPPDLQQLLNGTGLQQANLNDAIAFFGALNYTTNPNPKITYQCIYGVVGMDPKYWSANLPLVFNTTTGYTYTQNPSKLTAVRTDGGGDLIVPKDSAMFVGNTSITPQQRHEVKGADHIYMPSNPDVQKVVNTLLDFAS